VKKESAFGLKKMMFPFMGVFFSVSIILQTLNIVVDWIKEFWVVFFVAIGIFFLIHNLFLFYSSAILESLANALDRNANQHHRSTSNVTVAEDVDITATSSGDLNPSPLNTRTAICDSTQSTVQSPTNSTGFNFTADHLERIINTAIPAIGSILLVITTKLLG